MVDDFINVPVPDAFVSRRVGLFHEQHAARRKQQNDDVRTEQGKIIFGQQAAY